jgi:hypothetical protein
MVFGAISHEKIGALPPNESAPPVTGDRVSERMKVADHAQASADIRGLSIGEQGRHSLFRRGPKERPGSHYRIAIGRMTGLRGSVRSEKCG